MKLLTTFLYTTIIFLNMPDSSITEGPQTVSRGQKPLFSFGIITDIHSADKAPVGSRFYRSSRAKLEEAVNSFKKDSADFIINLGDIIDTGFVSYKPVLETLNSSGLKVYNVTGNHDYSVEPKMKRKILVLTSSKEGYYSLVHKNFRFIFLNGNEISTYSTNNKAEIKQAREYISFLKNNGNINAIDWNGGIFSKQLTWLSKQLDEATTNGEKVFISCHFPVFPENVHNLLTYVDVLTILEKYKNVIAWFNGHNHAGNYGNFNMIHFVTFKGMVETETANSFALVEVYKNKIWINGYGREKSQILAY
jgi:manganese-dependent ADP-ribose/CDP-alcohol diphosphatase